MADGFRKAQITSKYIHDLVRKRALAAVAEHDASLSKVYDKIAAGLRRDLRAAGFSVKQVREILDKHLAGTRDERVRAIEEAIRSGAQEGRKLDQETFDAVFGAREGGAADPLEGPAPSSAPVLRLSSRRRRGSEEK